MYQMAIRYRIGKIKGERRDGETMRHKWGVGKVAERLSRYLETEEREIYFIPALNGEKSATLTWTSFFSYSSPPTPDKKTGLEHFFFFFLVDFTSNGGPLPQKNSQKGTSEPKFSASYTGPFSCVSQHQNVPARSSTSEK